MTPQCLTSIGLILDMTGVLLLFFFGLSHVVTHNGAVFLTAFHEDQKVTGENKRKARFYIWVSRFALSLILAGFALQLRANLM